MIPSEGEVFAGAPSLSRGHPLLRVLSGAPTNYKGEISLDIHTFIHIIAKIYGWEKVRGIRYTNHKESLPHVKKTRMWLEQTPLVLAWVSSPRFLISPDKFPSLVEQMMLPFPLSPYLMSFYVLNSQKPTVKECILLAYSLGLSLQEISLMLNCSQRQVVFCMQEALHDYLQDPGFKLWSWGLDWEKVIIPEDVDESILTRLGLKNILAVNGQFDLKPRSEEYKRLQVIANSPRMQRIALYAPKSASRLPSGWLTKGLARYGTTQQTAD